MSSAEWRPGDYTNACVIAESVHFTLFFSVEEVVVVLHADEFRPVVLLGEELHRRELVCLLKTG